MNVTLQLGLSGPEPLAIYRQLVESGIAGSGLPSSVSVDGKSRKPSAGWIERSASACKEFFIADWQTGASLGLNVDGPVLLRVPHYDLEPYRLLEFLSNVPFTIGSSATLYPEWLNGALGEKYRAPSFAEQHWPHGWACFFKGEGHNRLVSRRWLDFGPWRLLKGPNDTSLVQFHDLEADALTALAQARIGHQRMGISEEGGFIQKRYVYAYDLKGLYYAEQRQVHIVVHGRKVTQREMLDACAARLYQRLGPEQPLDNIVYVFVEEEAALAHLHELWLRELGCRMFREGQEIDAFTHYHPAPVHPEWVGSVLRQESANKV
jgi:hypothetical protein